MGSNTEQLLRARDEGRLVSFKLPGANGLALAVERHMLEQAMDYWHLETDEAKRAHVIGNVRRTLKTAVKRMRRGRLTGKEYDDLANDAVIWLAYEMMFADGERYLVDARKMQLPQ